MGPWRSPILQWRNGIHPQAGENSTTRSVAESVEPHSLSSQRVLGVLDLLLVASTRGISQLLFELRDLGRELRGEVGLTRLLHGICSIPAVLIELADMVLHLAKAILDLAEAIPRNLADRVPASLDAEQSILGRGAVLGREELLCLLEQRKLLGEIAGVLFVFSGPPRRSWPRRSRPPRP